MSDNTAFARATFERNLNELRWSAPREAKARGFSGGSAWRSNGGDGRRHPCRSLPYTLTASPPSLSGRLTSVHLIGVFATEAHPGHEPAGALGATLGLEHHGEVVFRANLIQGRHYTDARDITPVYRMNGDGTRVETLGTVDVEGVTHRVDAISFEVPLLVTPDRLTFRDLGTAASFILFEVVFEFEPRQMCPFRGSGQTIALSEINAILRLRNRARFDAAVEQLIVGMGRSETMDDARGQALLFLGVTAGGLIEMGAPAATHRFQLDAARRLDGADSLEAISSASMSLIDQLTRDHFSRTSTTRDPYIEQALRVIENAYATDISDEEVAQEIGLSTSHFRHLFRQAMQIPFHKYLTSLRLEKAREFILSTDLPITSIAEQVGFVSAAHFSRAFHKRFQVAPSALRERK